MKRSVSAALVLTVVIVAAAHAELEPLTPEQLRATASHVVTGDVTALYREQVKDGDWLRTRGVVEIQVSKVEKGDRIAPADTVYARFRGKEWVEGKFTAFRFWTSPAEERRWGAGVPQEKYPVV
jgi:hypothetical protein